MLMIPFLTSSGRISGRLTVSSLFLCSITLAGCGSGGVMSATAYPVKGSVLLPSGKPLTSGKVVFLPKGGTGMTATGEISSDGSFSLKTADGSDGAPAGEYKVRIEPSAFIKGGRVDTKAIPFPASYMDEDGETGLTATIKSEATQLEPFKLVVKKVNPNDDSRND